MCVCVCMYVCMYVCTYLCLSVDVSMYIRARLMETHLLCFVAKPQLTENRKKETKLLFPIFYVQSRNINQRSNVQPFTKLPIFSIRHTA